MDGNPPPRDTDRRRLLGRQGAVAIGAVAAGLAGTAVALALVAAPTLKASVGELTVPWIIVAGLYVLAEWRAVHVEFRREAHSLSLSEFPLVLGLFTLTGYGLIAAAVAGSVVAFAFARRQRPAKVLFNGANIALVTTVVVLTFRHLSPTADVTAPSTWAAALAATLLGDVVAVGAISLAIALAEGRWRRDGVARAAGLGLANVATATCVALAGVAVTAVNPAAVVLLLVPVAVVYGAFRAFTAERRKHERLEFLYESSRLLQESGELEEAMQALLAQARLSLRARVAELVLFPERPDDPTLCASVADGRPAEGLAPRASDDAEALLRRVAERGRAVRTGSSRAPASLRRYVAARGFDDAMAAPLLGGGGVIGVLLVADRLVETSAFSEDDLRLFATLAGQTSVSLQNGQLERTLDQLTTLRQRLRDETHRDSVTGLANRPTFTAAVRGAVEAGDGGRCVGVLALDLDDFKSVNEVLGHSVGDTYLVTVADRLRDAVRPGDLVARLGGDEFAILLRDIDGLDDALTVATRVQTAVARPIALPGVERRGACAVGVAMTAAGDDATDLLRDADIALREARRRGRSGVAVFETGMHEDVARRTTLRHELQQALVESQLRVHYQPYFGLPDGEVRGVEALVRWEHPERGLLAPGAFLDVAHDSGLIDDIDEFVLAEACRVAARWLAAAAVPVTMSVNISAHRLADASFPDTVDAALRASGLPASRLQLEVTEHQVLESGGVAVAVLRRLRDLGVQVAVDDFGTGYSSLAYLRDFPVDVIKIAKPFVDDIDAPRDRALTRAILELCRVLGLRTIAEGIETGSQRELLESWGCDAGQGFLLSRPLDEAAAERLLRGPSTAAVSTMLGATG